MAPPIGKPLHNETLAANQRADFLRNLADGYTVSQSAMLAGINARTVYRWRDECEEFDRDWEIAYAAGGDALAMEARRRAVQGVTKKKFTAKGMPVFDLETGKQYIEHEYSDGLLMFMLSARDPLRYCSKARTEYIKRQWAEQDKRRGLQDESTKPVEDVISMLDDLARAKALTAPS